MMKPKINDTPNPGWLARQKALAHQARLFRYMRSRIWCSGTSDGVANYDLNLRGGEYLLQDLCKVLELPFTSKNLEYVKQLWSGMVEYIREHETE